MTKPFSVKLMRVVLFCLLANFCRGDDYAANNGWRFHNFTDPIFSWDIYRDTFIGIYPTEDAVASPFDVLFYEEVYKDKLSANGNCFGMSLLNLMIQKNGGYLGFCAPVTQYSGDPNSPGQGPTDQSLRRAINIMHGHQVNLPTVQFLLNIFAQHFSKDASYAFDQFNYWQSRGDLTLVSITKDVLPTSGGHTLIAYRGVDLGGGNKKLFVLDPNRTWGNSTDQGWYNSESNYIQITNQAWSFIMAGPETWSGDPGSGGNIVITPISITGPHSRSPGSLGTTVIGTILNTLLLTGDGALIEQISDGEGKRLYRPGTLEIDNDPATGMLNLLPWVPSDQEFSPAPTRSQVLFQMGSSRGAIRLSIKAGAGGYKLSSTSGRTIVTVTARGGSGSDVLTIRNPGTATSAVVLDNRRGASEYDVTITHAKVPNAQVRVLSASRLRINGPGAVEIGLANNGEALSISSAQASLQYNMNLTEVTRKGPEAVTRNDMVQDAGASRTVQPVSWQRLKDKQVIEQWRALIAR